MYNIFFVRHGESQSNAGEPTGNPEEVELTPHGRAQARCVADYFLQQHIALHLIITSSFQRSIQTSLYTRGYFPSIVTETWNVREFTYLSSLHHQVLTLEERRPLVENYWKQLLPASRDASDSESFDSFIARVRQFIARLRREIHGNVVVFTHEQFMNAVFWLLQSESIKISRQTMGEYRDYFKQHRIPNGAIVKIQLSQGRFFGPQKPLTRHLYTVEADLVPLPR